MCVMSRARIVLSVVEEERGEVGGSTSPCTHMRDGTTCVCKRRCFSL